MLKQSELSAEEQAEAFRRADDLFRAESEQARNAKAAADAAQEMGIPQEYLDRAAAQIHAEKVERIKSQRNRRNVTIAVGAAAVAVALGASLLIRPQTVPGPVAAVAAQQLASPTVDLTHEDQATTVFRNVSSESKTDTNSYSLKLNGFHDSSSYQANHGFSIDGSLDAYKQVSFFIKGDGIANTRVDLRAGNTRWNSRQISLTPQGERVAIRFDQLQQQTKQGNQWVGSGSGNPQGAQSLVFKFGAEINPPDTKGTVTISDVRFE
ncbi:MAG: hypothetical protein QM758_24280 [Armatimonas sp.]